MNQAAHLIFPFFGIVEKFTIKTRFIKNAKQGCLGFES
jgi:hypothetical protein